jgi:hypothetical protein
MKNIILVAAIAAGLSSLRPAFAFEGRIQATFTRGGETEAWAYTVGTNSLRVELTDTNRPNPVDVLELKSGQMTLVFPNNRSFIRLKSMGEDRAEAPRGFPGMPGIPSGIGPQAQSQSMPRIGPTNLPGSPMPPPPMPQLPNLPPGVGLQSAPGASGAGPSGLGGAPALSMPMMPPPMMAKMELTSTGEHTNLLGLACEKFQLKQRGEVMEIWATDALLPFQNYVRDQPHRFGPRMIEAQWGDLLKARRLFPLRAVLKFENGAERLRFEVKSVTPGRIEGKDGALFQPPPDYHELEPLPF